MNINVIDNSDNIGESKGGNCLRNKNYFKIRIIDALNRLK
jgi:hypothetical protein